MQTLNKVNPTATNVLDMRRGDNTQHGVAVLTPWGQFRSLAVCVDHVMTLPWNSSPHSRRRLLAGT